MQFQTVGVVGAGQMGNGIAQVAAQSGHSVVMMDVSPQAVERGLHTVSTSLDRLIKKEKLTEVDKERVLKAIRGTSRLEDLSQCDIVIEAATENLDLKLKIFKDLDQTVRADSPLVSNTSSISITRIAASTRRPDRVCGMHFMNPVPLMTLVEGIRGLQTSNETFEAVRGLAQKMGKVFIEGRDMPGFIVNRILMPMINEAFYALYEGVGTPEGIDEAMKLGTNQPMGPLTLADFIGLDTCLAIMQVLHGGLGDSKYRPCPLLIKYVEAGWFGRKSGRGVYSYTK